MKKIKLSQEEFSLVDDEDFECLNKFKWSISRWSGLEYAVRRLHLGTFNGVERGKMIRMHRIIMSASDSDKIDHINGNGLDNRRCNLRVCTQSQNIKNQRKTRGTSKYKGVHWHKPNKKWVVQIKLNGIGRYVGCFISEIQAAKAYNKAAKKLHGEFARLNVL